MSNKMDLSNLMHIATKSSKIDITLEKDTQLISEKFSRHLSKGDIIFLYGEIGVGKTTFIKFMLFPFSKTLNFYFSRVHLFCVFKYNIKSILWFGIN